MIFVHDHKFVEYKNDIYTVGSLNDKLFERYEKIFGNVLIIANKVVGKEAGTKENKLSGKRMYLFNQSNIIGLKKIKVIREVLKNEKYVILRLPSFNGCIVGTICLLTKKPYLVEVVGCANDAFKNHGISGKIIAPFITMYVKYITKRASYVLYVTEEFLQKRYPTKGYSISCSDVLLTNNFIKEPKKRKSDTERLILGTAGALNVRYKGQEFVLHAIKELKEEGLEVEYRLAGAGNAEFLRTLSKELNIENSVIIEGLLNHSQIQEFYKELDIYVQPSLTEGMPRAVIEAMNCGTYCIGTMVGGIPELVGEANCFEKGNINQIKQLIKNYFILNMNEVYEKNYKVIQKFQPDYLNNKRNDFYTDFKKSVDERK